MVLAPVLRTLLTAAAPLLALAAACGPAERAGRGAPPPRDLLLVTIDTLRQDATGFSGAGLVATPALDALAAGGAVYPNAHAHAVMTLPSHASILTGLVPHRHGVRDNAGFRLGENLPTLATRLGAAGRATGAFVSAFPLDRRFGLDAGFDVYDDEYEGYGAGAFTYAERPGERTVERALAWWRENAGRPRFMWVHLFTPHFPYEPPEPYASRHAGAPYYGEAAWTDAQLAPLLEPLVQAADGSVAVIVTSDHGEGLGDHGEATHGLFAYESTLRVPLVVWSPGRVAPGRDARPARHVDLVPTALDLLGLASPEGLDGRSLVIPDPGDDPGTYFEALTAALNRGWAPLHGFLEEGKKAIDLPIPELYDLERDPGESDNLAPARPETLLTLLERIPDEASVVGATRRVSDEELARLRSLGYAASASGGPAQAPDDPALDPKSLVAVDDALSRALTEHNAGRPDAAIAALERLLADHPAMATLYGHLAFMLVEAGRPERAAALLEQAVALGIADESLRRKLALTSLELGRAADAERVLAEERESSDPQTQLVLGRVAAALGRPDEARRRIARALELDPTFPEARIDEGILLLGEGRIEPAREALGAGLEREPFHAEGWNALGVARLRSADPAGALEAWRRAVEVDPRLADAWFNLALVHGRSGELSQAASALERYIALADGEEAARARAMLGELRDARR